MESYRTRSRSHWSMYSHSIRGEEAAVGLLEEQGGSAAAVLNEDACDDVWSQGYRDRNGLWGGKLSQRGKEKVKSKATCLHSKTFRLGSITAAIFTCTCIPSFCKSFLQMTRAEWVTVWGRTNCKRLVWDLDHRWRVGGGQERQSVKVCCKQHCCMDSLPSPSQVSQEGYRRSYSSHP